MVVKRSHQINQKKKPSNKDSKPKTKKSGLDMGDIINEFKIENQNRPKKEIVYPIALILLSIFGYLNIKRRT